MKIKAYLCVGYLTSNSVSAQPASKSSKAAALVPSPGLYQYLQNEDYGIIDRKKFKIDLSLQVISPEVTDAFLLARNKYMTVITGDIEDVNVAAILKGDPEYPRFNRCDNPLPEVIDDLYICGSESPIDGAGTSAGNIFATVYFPTLLPTGNIVLDPYDLPTFIQNGLLNTMIMDYVGDIILFLRLNEKLTDVIDVAEFKYIGKYGNKVWQDDWKCLGTPPLYSNNGDIGWDINCLPFEVMSAPRRYLDSSLFGGTSKLSKLSIAAFKDFGYEVNPKAADKYDGKDTTCCSTNTNSASMMMSSSSRPDLPEESKEYAIAQGRKMFNITTAVTGTSSSPVVVGTVMIEVNGYFYAVDVTDE